jgi:hypothetical protein
VHQVDDDDSNFYTPYILDPAKPTELIVGTCRVWRGSNAAAGWPNNSTSNVLSHRLGTTSDSACSVAAGDDLIQSLAAGGPSGTKGSKVVWAGTSGGHLYLTTNATSGAATWTDVTTSINPLLFPISGIALDPLDKSGLTAWVTIQGFTGSGIGHVWMTQDGGNTWTDMDARGGGLPDAPVNDIVIDPTGYGNVYVATDIGVYTYSPVLGLTWEEVGPFPGSGSGYLPNSAVFHIAVFHNGSDLRLRAWTHGRGVWETGLTSSQYSVSTSALRFSASIGSTSSVQSVTLKNLSSTDMKLTVPPLLEGTNPGQFALAAASNACSTTLAAGSSCQFGVQFSPTQGGNSNAILYIAEADNLGIMPDIQVYLAGSAITPAATDFGLSASTTTSSINAGGAATFTLNVDNISGESGEGFNPALTLACSGLPDKSTCNLSSSSVSAAGSVTVTVKTTAPSGAQVAGNEGLGGTLVFAMALPGLAFFLPGAAPRRKRALMFLGLMMTFAMILGMGACGGGGNNATPTPVPGTTPGTYTVKIVGTYGSTSHEQDFTLTVN